MRLLTVSLLLLLLLAACAAPGQSTAIWEPNTPILDGTFETSLLVTEWKGNSDGNILFPFDPLTHAGLPNYAPISLGNTFFPAFSPDRQTLAVVTFPDESASRGDLLLIDLPSWTSRPVALGLHGWVNSVVFSPDGKQLAIAHGDSRYQITMVNLEEGEIRAQQPTDSFISRMKFTEDGQALMLYSPTTNFSSGVTTEPPKILLLSAADLTLHWSLALEDVHDGIFPKDENVTSANFYEPGNAYYVSPGLVFAPDRDALYIVHADSERLTTVDFASQNVRTVDIENRLTLVDRLLSLTAGVAHAKVADGITRQAAISPDGQFLYVVGVNSSTFQDEQGNWQVEQSPLGLEILQANDGSRVQHVDTDTTELSISQDGHFLYLRNWGNNQSNIPWTEIFDTPSRKRIARKTELSGNPALLMNGELVLVSTYSTSETSHHMSVLAPDGSRPLAEWTDSDYIWCLSAQ